MYEISQHEQGSPGWFMDRLGKPTASFFDKILTPTGKRSTQTEELINRLVAERIAGFPDETFQSDAMLRGQELEHEALEFINFTHGYNFKRVGFLQSLEDEYGASSDALDEDLKIGLEMKCPSLHTHLAYITAGGLPKKYIAQVQGGMMVTGFERWVFMSYHPEIKPLVVVVDRDEEYIKNLRLLILEVCKDIRKKQKEVTEYIEA
jgi:hypothetical protein